MKKIKSKIILYRNYIVRVIIKRALENQPLLFTKIQSYRNRNVRLFDNRVVGKHSDLVIDGFPRSGNSFSVKAFKKAQSPQNVQIGHHMHSYAQIRQAVELNIPTMVLIREPYDAIVSYGAFSIQQLNNDKEQYAATWKIKWDIEYYIKFYSEILKLTDDILVVPFEEVINDFGISINRFNNKFNANYKIFNHSIENQNTIFENSWYHLSPSKERNSIKPFVKNLLNQKECKNLLLRAEEVYQLVIKNVVNNNLKK